MKKLAFALSTYFVHLESPNNICDRTPVKKVNICEWDPCINQSFYQNTLLLYTHPISIDLEGIGGCWLWVFEYKCVKLQFQRKLYIITISCYKCVKASIPTQTVHHYNHPIQKLQRGQGIQSSGVTAFPVNSPLTSGD